MCNGQSTIQSKWGTAAVLKTASKASGKKVRWYPQTRQVVSNSKQEAARDGKDCPWRRVDMWWYMYQEPWSPSIAPSSGTSSMTSSLWEPFGNIVTSRTFTSGTFTNTCPAKRSGGPTPGDSNSIVRPKAFCCGKSQPVLESFQKKIWWKGEFWHSCLVERDVLRRMFLHRKGCICIEV